MSWLKYIAQRGLLAIAALFVLSVITFLIMNARGEFCSLRTQPANSPFLSKDEKGNLTLYVSNQSFEVPTVDVWIWIDDSLVVSECFEVGNQHNWRGFVLDLAKGEHTIRILSKHGTATYNGSFHVLSEHWIVVDYWPGRLSFKITDEPVYFD